MIECASHLFTENLSALKLSPPVKDTTGIQDVIYWNGIKLDWCDVR